MLANDSPTTLAPTMATLKGPSWPMMSELINPTLTRLEEEEAPRLEKPEPTVPQQFNN